MNDSVKNRMKVMHILVAVAVFVGIFSSCAWGYSDQMRKTFVKGPWELMIKMGMEGEEMSFPVSVPDEEKAGKLDISFPVLGTPIEVRLEQYVPNLKWESSIADKNDGGVVAAITIKGVDMVQEMLLDSTDPKRKSLSSPVGGVVVKKVHDPDIFTQLAKGFKKGKPVGIVSIWLEGVKKPVEVLVNSGKSVKIPGTNYTLRVLEYLPHYSVDTETKEIVNKSERPLNPAIKIRLEDGKKSYEQWLWSKFPTSPHAKTKLPLRIEFNDVDTGGEEGNYILIAAVGTEPRIIFINDGKTQMEKVEFGKDYPFARETYTFSIGKVVHNATILNSWKNISDNLASPAVVGTIIYADSEKEVVLELNKPFHQNTNFGTILLLYKQQAGSARMTN